VRSHVLSPLSWVITLQGPGPPADPLTVSELRAHWLTAIPLPQPGPSIHPLARTHWPPNQDCNSGGPVHCCLITVFQYRRFLSFHIRWHIYAKTVTLEGPFTLTTATLLCRQTSSLLNWATLVLLTESSPARAQVGSVICLSHLNCFSSVISGDWL
jgi:hypothetical protein